MKFYEVIFVVWPLLIFLAGIVIYEIKTGRIPDIAVLPAALYFLMVAMRYGVEPWWHYPLGMIGIFAIFILLAILVEKVSGHEMLGGGAIKLWLVVGAALGMIAVLEAGIVVIVAFAIAFFIALQIFGVNNLPSSPLTLFSVIAVYIWNYGLTFFIPR